MAVAFFTQPFSNNFQLRFYGSYLPLFFPFSVSVHCTSPSLPPSLSHSLSISVAPSLTSLSLSQLTSSVVFDPFLSFPLLPPLLFPPPLFPHLQFFITASCSGVGNEGSVIKHGRCLPAGSQPVYRHLEKIEMRMERKGQELED